jgi:hypothetical protein
MGFMRTVAHSGLPQRCQAARSRRTSRFETLYAIKASSQVSTPSLRRRCLCVAVLLTRQTPSPTETAAEQTAHASLPSVERDPRQEKATERRVLACFVELPEL